MEIGTLLVMTVIGGIGFSFGGALHFPEPGGSYELPSDFYGFNAESTTWAAYQNMLRGRMNFGAGVIDGEGHTFNGFTYMGADGDHEAILGGTPGFSTRWVERFNFDGNSWVAAAQIFSDDDRGFGGGVAECGAYGLGFMGGSAGQIWAEYNGLTDTAIKKMAMGDRYSALWSCTVLAVN